MTQSDSAPAHVLIVEDERDLADLYAAWLKDSYDVQTVYDGEEAISRLDEEVDVLLLDRRMPGVSGDEVLDYIRENGLDVRVAVVSAVTPDFDVIGMGFDEYLVKPVDSDELHGTIERMLTRASYSDTLQELEQLIATKTTLEAEKSDAELQESPEYDRLLTQIETGREQADKTISEFDDADFEAAFRDLGSGHSSDDSSSISGDPE